MKPLFEPAGVAIIGASESNFYARNVIDRLTRYGYAGEVALVNPRHRQVLGRPTISSLDALDGEYDAAVVVVRQDRVLKSLEDAAAAGIKAAVVVSAGFGSDSGSDGLRQRDQLNELASRTGIVVCGPSCLGVISARHRFHGFCGHVGADVGEGSMAVVSQSGGNVHAFLEGAAARGLGFTYLVSSGSEICVETSDYIEYFLEDPHTSVVGAFVESFKDVERFVRVAELALERQKPLLVLKVGRTSAASRAALGHTGAITGSDKFFDVLFKKLGVVRSNTVEELLDRAMVLASSDRNSWPRGQRLGVVSISGGTAGVLADVASLNGLTVPRLTAETRRRIAVEAPPGMGTENPLDVSSQAQRDNRAVWQATIGAVADDPKIDAVVVAQGLSQTRDEIEFLADARTTTGTAVVLTATSTGIDVRDEPARDASSELGIPYAPGIDACMKAVSSAAFVTNAYRTYSQLRPWLHAVTSGRSGRRVSAPSEQLNEYEARALLGRYGIVAPDESIARSAAEAETFCGGVRGPVAMKGVAVGLNHKSELGLVRLGVRPADVASTFAEIAEAALRNVSPEDFRGVIVQEMVEGAQVFFGVSGEDQFAPLVVVGMGGELVEVFTERDYDLGPLTRAAAKRLLSGSAVGRVLKGYRSQPARDLDAAAGALAGLSRFAYDARSWLGEAEINPLIVGRPGEGAVAVDTLIVSRRQL